MPRGAICQSSFSQNVLSKNSSKFNFTNTRYCRISEESTKKTLHTSMQHIVERYLAYLLPNPHANIRMFEICLGNKDNTGNIDDREAQ